MMKCKINAFFPTARYIAITRFCVITKLSLYHCSGYRPSWTAHNKINKNVPLGYSGMVNFPLEKNGIERSGGLITLIFGTKTTCINTQIIFP